MSQPTLADLTTRFLATRTALGIAMEATSGDVVPHEVAGGFRVAAQMTWTECLVAIRLFGATPEKIAAPPEWGGFAALDTPVLALPFAAGLFPQRVRAMSGLIGAFDPATLRPRAPAVIPGFSALRSWVRKAGRGSPTHRLIAAGIAVSLGDRVEAESALADGIWDGPWQAARVNQRAAIDWLCGDCDAAATAWNAVAGPATAFNRGLAALFVHGPGVVAGAEFQTAAAGLPEASGWCHLAQLYRSLAVNHG